MKQRELVLARTFHPTTKQLLQITPGSDRKTPFPHSATRFSCPLQQDHDTVATLGNRRWISAAALSHVGLGFGRSCCSQVLLWHFGTRESNPSWLGLLFTPQAVPGGKVGDSSRGRGSCSAWGRTRLWFPLRTAEGLPCLKLGRSSPSTAGSCLPSPPSPLFGPGLKKRFCPKPR